MQAASRKSELARYYQLYCDMLYRIAFVYMKNEADAEDVVQECFIRLMQSKMQFANNEHVKAWLIVVASNLCKDSLKAKRRKNVPLEVVQYQLSDHAEVYQENEMLKLILELPDFLITPVYLYYYEGYSSNECARILGLNPSTLRGRLRTAREKLKLALEDDRNEK